jgi:hypothetical protein
MGDLITAKELRVKQHECLYNTYGEKFLQELLDKCMHTAKNDCLSKHITMCLPFGIFRWIEDGLHPIELTGLIDTVARLKELGFIVEFSNGSGGIVNMKVSWYGA